MSEYFVATSGGSDSADGLDIFGFGLSTASWTASTKQLTQSFAFNGYEWESGDRVYLTHASITDGLYEIASKDSDDDITLVDSISGSDETNVASSDGPFATLTHCESVMAAGDQAYLCTINDGETFDSEASYPVFFTTTGDDSSGYPAWYGCNSHGKIGTVAVVDAGASGDVLRPDSTGDRTLFMYIRGQNGTQGWNIQGSAYTIFFRCEGFDNSADGFNVNTSYVTMVECHADNNSTYGFHMASLEHHCIGCVASNNGSRGFMNASADSGTNRQLGERCSQIFGLAYNDPGGSNQEIGFKRPRFMANCVAYNNADDGVSYFNEFYRRYPVIINSISTDNAAYGIDDEGMPVILINNGITNNTSGDTRSTPKYEEARIDLEDTPYVSVVQDNFTLNRGARPGLLAQTRGKSMAAYIKGANLVPDPGFDAASGEKWTPGSWTIADGKASHVSGLAGLANIKSFVIGGTAYEIFFTLSDVSAGSMSIVIGGKQGALHSADGVKREILTANTDGQIIFAQTSGFTGSVDDVFVAPLHDNGTTTRFETESHLGVAFPKDRLVRIQ